MKKGEGNKYNMQKLFLAGRNGVKHVADNSKHGDVVGFGDWVAFGVADDQRVRRNVCWRRRRPAAQVLVRHVFETLFQVLNNQSLI